jgi:prepilin-type N-terminal cleavage/methylation domain-containing protein
MHKLNKKWELINSQNITTPGLPQINYFCWNFRKYINQLNPGVKNKSAFTLVELIIVITILAILATIAFISFQSYSKNARDWNRLTALRNIKSWLEIYYTQTSSYPDVESWTLIQSSWWLTTIWTQWYFWDTNSRLLKFSKTPTDPYDGTKYIYSINTNKNKYQIMWFLETSDYLSLLNNTYAATDYSTRTPKTLWDNLWILLDSSNNPISWTWIDIENYTWSLKAVFNDSYNISWTWVTLKWIISSFKDWKLPWTYYDKNCDLPDVVIWNQVWAWCNSTMWSWLERLQQPATIPRCYDYSWNSLTTSTYCDIWMTSMDSSSKEKTWSDSISSSINGTVNNIWWKFYKLNDLNLNCKWWDFVWIASNSNCPCPSWWHVPTDDEWIVLENNLWCTNSLNTSWRCNWLGWKNNYISWKSASNNIIQALKIPLSWPRNFAGSSYIRRGYETYLRSSSFNNNKAYLRFFIWNNEQINRSTESGYQFNVRCIKD